MKSTKAKKLLILSGLCLSSFSAYAFANSNTLLPLTPRVSALGLAGTEGLVGGDAMLPLLGTENNIWYFDAQAKTAFNSDWSASLGSGFRFVQNDQRILGAYVFVDRDISSENQQFWFISPGIESMGVDWDFRANGYIPTGSQQQLIATGLAADLGNDSFESFDGHTQYDALVNEDEEIGWGADAEIGRRIPILPGMRVYAGGYHFNFNNADSINGVAGRIELPLNANIALTVRDSYDNMEHNTIMAGIRLTLGGVNKHPKNPQQPIRERLLDPIDRNLATLGQGTAEPIQTEFTVLQYEQVARDNIWFFSPNASGIFNQADPFSSCTYANQCASTEFTQATIDSIEAHPAKVTLSPAISPYFYLAPGNYSATNGLNPLNFDNAYIFGRTPDFRRPDQAAFLTGALNFFGTDGIDSLIVLNNPAIDFAAALTINTNSKLMINNAIIGGSPATPQSYATGIIMADSKLTTRGNTIINAYADGAPAIGILTNDSQGSLIDLRNTTVNVENITSEGLTEPMPFSAIGILTNNQNGSNIALNSSRINVNILPTIGSGTDNSTVGAAGIIDNNATQQDHLTISNSAITVSNQFSAENVRTTVVGIGDPGHGFDLTLDNSAITISAISLGDLSSPQAFGIFSLSDDNPDTVRNDVIIRNHSSINVLGQGGLSVKIFGEGIFMEGGENRVLVTDSTIKADTISGQNQTKVQDFPAAGILIINPNSGSNSLTIKSSDISASFNGSSHNAQTLGVGALGDVNTINITDSTITSTNNINFVDAALDTDNPIQSIAVAGQANTSNNMQIINSKLISSVNLTSGTVNSYISNQGLIAQTNGSSDVYLSNSGITTTTLADAISTGETLGMNINAALSNNLTIDKTPITVTTTISNLLTPLFNDLNLSTSAISSNAGGINTLEINNSQATITATITNNFGSNASNNGQVLMSGISSQGNTGNTITLNKSSINAQATITNGLGSNIMNTTGANIGQGNANASLILNASQITVDNELTNNGVSTSTNFVGGTYSGLGSGAALTISLNNGSQIKTDANILNNNIGSGQLTIGNQGINIDGSNSGTGNMVTIDSSSSILVNAATTGTPIAASNVNANGVNTYNSSPGATTVINNGSITGSATNFGSPQPFNPINP